MGSGFFCVGKTSYRINYLTRIRLFRAVNFPINLIPKFLYEIIAKTIFKNLIPAELYVKFSHGKIESIKMPSALS